jgi:hypothetical protein
MKKHKLSLLGRIRAIFHANRRYKSYYVFDAKPKEENDYKPMFDDWGKQE